MTSRTAQRRKRAQKTGDRNDPLERTLSGRGPRCQCRHGAERCPRSAVYRFSVICAEPDCGNATHVYLACEPCKVEWVRHNESCPHCPEVRVSLL
jgi:hypothetical protein